MKKFYILVKYLKYLFVSYNRHGIHSPFVYDLIDNVIYDTTNYPAFIEIEKIRVQLKKDEKELMIEDYGAGSSINPSLRRKISDIATHSLKPKKYARLLFRLAKHFKPQNILELGTSLGVTTIYLSQAQAENKCTIYTIEGCPQIASVANENFIKANVNNIKLFKGKFEEVLPDVIAQHSVWDFVFFDGNHKKEPTLSYFTTCLEKAGNDSVFVFDDIHWSDEMEQAWEIIKINPKVRVTIDLFFVGLVFFRKEQPKQDFIIRY
ncbi:MAG: class I SAM-dependent methyltransferase [Bacteroidota bacterium]|nr:class I SAM-dependent methyltransferase [Bacteroidota bacterium]